jgi:hypothetical protein
MTYRKAWGQIKAMEEQLGLALVEKQAGGRGGGARLTRRPASLSKYLRLAQGIEEEVDRRFREIFMNCVRQILHSAREMRGMAVFFSLALFCAIPSPQALPLTPSDFRRAASKPRPRKRPEVWAEGKHPGPAHFGGSGFVLS